MHKLERSNIPSPTCLSRYRYGLNTWDDLDSKERQEIRKALEEMQGQRCAYCECGLNRGGQHIEHFRQRSCYPQFTFNWDNLFLSCMRIDSCGKNKDKCGAYNHNNIIKPDIEDPEHFFLFVSNGSIELRPGLTAEEQDRAKETLRVFNLDAQWGPLRRLRKTAVLGFAGTLSDLQEFRHVCSDQEIVAFLEGELTNIRDYPFYTAIKHFLTMQGVTYESSN